MTFHVGQKVVCVDDGPGQLRGTRVWERPIVNGQIYTIRWVGIAPYYNRLGVRLVGVDRGPDKFNREWDDMPLNAHRFRPLIERKTDISIFTAMLKPSKVEA